MSNKLYVGNMNYDTTDEQLIELFSEHGTVTEANIVTDRISNRSRGFGFVTFEDEESCKNACEALNGYEFQGRTLKVNVAFDKPRREKSNNRRRY